MQLMQNPRKFQRYRWHLCFWVFLLCLPTQPCTHYYPYPVDTFTPPKINKNLVFLNDDHAFHTRPRRPN